MNLPEQVVKQMENAQKLQQELYGEKAAPAPVAENTPVPEAPVDEPAALQTEATPSEAVSESTPTPQPQDDFKHQYEVLQGKYSAEVPRLHQQIRERDQQLQQLADRLSQLEKQAEQVKEVAETEPTNQKDVDDFGADLVDMVNRIADSKFGKREAALTKALEKRFDELMSRLGIVQEKVVQNEVDRFWSQVKVAVPDWEQVDQDPRWIEWLDTSPEFSEETYREMAGKAIAKGNAGKVAKLVETWKATLPQVRQAQKQQANQAELERQIAPTTARAAQPAQSSAGQKIWTAAEYEYVHSNKARNDLAPADLERLQIEAQQAVADGRIRW